MPEHADDCPCPCCKLARLNTFACSAKVYIRRGQPKLLSYADHGFLLTEEQANLLIRVALSYRLSGQTETGIIKKDAWVAVARKMKGCIYSICFHCNDRVLCNARCNPSHAFEDMAERFPS